MRESIPLHVSRYVEPVCHCLPSLVPRKKKQELNTKFQFVFCSLRHGVNSVLVSRALSRFLTITNLKLHCRISTLCKFFLSWVTVFCVTKWTVSFLPLTLETEGVVLTGLAKMSEECSPLSVAILATSCVRGGLFTEFVSKLARPARI